MGYLSQEAEDKKAYLKRYKKTLALIDRLKSKVAILEDRIGSPRSPNLSGMPRGGTRITDEDLIADKAEIEDRILRLESKASRYKKEILDVIDELDDPRYAEVLESYFIRLKDFETIAEENNYTTRHVARLYSEGINNVNLMS